MAVRTNLAPNGSWEDGASAPTPPASWSVLSGSGTGFFWEDNSSKHSTIVGLATRSLRLNNGTSASNALVSDPIAVKAGPCTVSIWAQVLAGTTNAGLIVRRASDKAILGTEQHWTAPNNAWTRKSTTFTLSADTNIEVVLGLGVGSGGASAGSVRFDELLVEETASLLDYFDGGFPDSASINYSWAGTAYNSKSIADDGTVTTPPPVVNNGWELVETHSSATTFASDGPLDSSKFYIKAGFNGTNGDGTYYADRVFVQGGQVIVLPDQDHIGGFDSRKRPITYGKWDVWAKVTPVKGYKGVIFLWPDSEQWNDGEWDFVECTDDSGATFQIFFHKPGNPSDNSKNKRVAQNITGAFNKFTIEKLPSRVTVKVNDITVYEVTDTAWVGTAPVHLVVQTDVGVSGANGISRRDNYPANTNPRFQLAISRIDISIPSTAPSSAPLSASDQGRSSDTAALGTTQTLMFASPDRGASSDSAQLLVPIALASTDQGRSDDTASLSVGGSTPSVLLTGFDAAESSDSAVLVGSAQVLQAIDAGRSIDYAALAVSFDLSPRPSVTPAADELYSRLGPYTTEDQNLGWPLLRFCEALSSSLQWADDLVRDGVDGPGWSAVMDLERVPTAALPWIAQFVGVDTVPGMDDDAQRLHIRETAGFQRGTVNAIKGAARQFLAGNKTVLLQERDTSAYHLTVTTFESYVPHSGVAQ